MLKKYNFLVLCAMGMSSGLFAQKIKEAAVEEGIELDIGCYFCSNFKELNYTTIDMILMAPHVRNQVEEVKNYVKEYDVPVMQINMQDYGLLKGKKILEQALEIMKTN